MEIFEPGKVWIQDIEGKITSELPNPRQSFDGHEVFTPWTDLQFLYFIGYAFRNYFTMPFLLAENGVEVHEEARHEEHGEDWRVLQATFPSEMDVHCPVQKFYFDDRGYSVRNDYFTEVSPGTAAHYTFDHQNFDGFIFPTRRRVVIRHEDRTLVSKPSIFNVDIHDILISRNR